MRVYVYIDTRVHISLCEHVVIYHPASILSIVTGKSSVTGTTAATVGIRAMGEWASRQGCERKRERSEKSVVTV